MSQQFLCCTLMSVPALRSMVEYVWRNVCQPILPIPARKAAGFSWREPGLAVSQRKRQGFCGHRQSGNKTWRQSFMFRAELFSERGWKASPLAENIQQHT